MSDTIDVLLVDDAADLTESAAELLEREDGRLDVATALDRMADLVDDLLALTGRHGEVDTGPVSLDSVVGNCWANVVSGPATLRVETDSVVRADRGRLRQVFENLFRNSVEHGSTDDRRAPRAGDSVDHASTGRTGVVVTVGDLEDGFYVEDDGPGIPAEEREGNFEAGDTTKSGGTDGGARFEITDVTFVE